MSKGKVVNGESVGVGSITESFSTGSTSRQKQIKTSLFLRKGEKPSGYSSKVSSASTSGASALKIPTRLDVISETEMVQKAASVPGEWKGKFKVLKESSEALTGTEFSPNVYSRQVLFKDPKTGQMFRVFQRNDIDPLSIVPKGKYKGRTNLEAMSNGYAPYTTSNEQVVIHHMGQDAFGPFVEITKTTHKPVFHNQFGYGQKHPTNPVIRSEFNPIREAYWRAYAEQFK